MVAALPALTWRALGALAAVVVAVGLLNPVSNASRPVGVDGLGTAPQQLQDLLGRPVLSGRPVVQHLPPIRDDLVEVDIYCDTYDHVKVAPLTLRVMDGRLELRRAVVRPADPGIDQTPNLLRFTFAAIPDSGQRHLVLELESSATTDAESVAPYITRAPAGLAPIVDSGRLDSWVLTAGLRYGQPVPVWQQVPAAVDRASQYRPDGLKGAGLLLVLGLGVAAAVGLLFSVAEVSFARTPAAVPNERVARRSRSAVMAPLPAAPSPARELEPELPPAPSIEPEHKPSVPEQNPEGTPILPPVEAPIEVAARPPQEKKAGPAVAKPPRQRRVQPPVAPAPVEVVSAPPARQKRKRRDSDTPVKAPRAVSPRPGGEVIIEEEPALPVAPKRASRAADRTAPATTRRRAARGG